MGKEQKKNESGKREPKSGEGGEQRSAKARRNVTHRLGQYLSEPPSELLAKSLMKLSTSLN